MKCDNDSSMGRDVGVPQCLFGKATSEVTIQYNEVEKDTLHLCDECTSNIKKDARRHGYKVSTKRIK